MMARTHECTGALAWLGLAAAVHPSAGQLLAGVVAAAGASIAPDLDHPQGTCAHSFPPVSHWLTERIERISGHHRGYTHTAWAVAVISVGTWAAVHYPSTSTPALVIFGVCALWFARVLAPAYVRYSVLLSVVAAVAACYAVRDYVHMGPWLAWAVGVGYLTHLVGDSFSESGIAWFQPWQWRLRFGVGQHGLIPVKSAREWWVAGVCGVLVLWLLYQDLGPAIAEHAHAV